MKEIAYCYRCCNRYCHSDRRSHRRFHCHCHHNRQVHHHHQSWRILRGRQSCWSLRICSQGEGTTFATKTVRQRKTKAPYHDASFLTLYHYHRNKSNLDVDDECEGRCARRDVPDLRGEGRRPCGGLYQA